MAIINRNIRLRRLEHGWTQKELGELCGVTTQTVCDWEKGRRKPSYEILYKLCKLFNIEHEEVKGLFEPVQGNQE